MANSWLSFLGKVHTDNKKKHGAGYSYKQSMMDAKGMWSKEKKSSKPSAKKGGNPTDTNTTTPLTDTTTSTSTTSTPVPMSAPSTSASVNQMKGGKRTRKGKSKKSKKSKKSRKTRKSKK